MLSFIILYTFYNTTYHRMDILLLYCVVCSSYFVIYNVLNAHRPHTIINNERYYASRQMEKFERELNSERLSKKEVSLGGKKQQLYYHEDLLVSYCCNRYTILSKSSC